jgi:hypothetical protein
MKDQLGITILAVLAAKQEIARLKQKLASDDARQEPVDDAEMGAEWIIKRLRSLQQSRGVESTGWLAAETSAR